MMNRRAYFQVRSEIQTREQEQEAEMERLVSVPIEPVKEKKEVIPVCVICAKL